MKLCGTTMLAMFVAALAALIALWVLKTFGCPGAHRLGRLQRSEPVETEPTQDAADGLEYPKIGRIDDAEIIADRIAEDGPVFRHLLAQETQNGITEVVVGRVAPIVRHVSVHQPSIGARLGQGAGSSWECNGV